MTTTTFEQVLAAVVAIACVLLLVRLCLPARWRGTVDRSTRRGWERTQRLARSTIGWRSSRKRAALEAQQAIERARRRGQWSGNVYTPKSFRRPRKPH